MPTRIHLDTDIGGDADDLCALAMLLGMPEVELTGITTSTEVDGLRAGCAAYALHLAGRGEVPVVAGAAGSIAGFLQPPGIEDLSRYWPEPIVARSASPGAALDLLAASIEGGATVVAIGPYTNLALLEVARPGILAAAHIVLMGGYITPPVEGLPPWGPEMDYNVQSDTWAARLVFGRGDPLLVPLLLPLETTLRESHLPALRAGGPLAKLISVQSALYGAEYGMPALGRRYPRLPDDLLNFHYDPLAAAVAAGWDGVEVQELRLNAVLRDRWLTFPAGDDGKATRVVTAVDGARFQREWLAWVGAV